MTGQNDIGKLFRDNFNDFEVHPPDVVWQQIESSLQASTPVAKPVNMGKRLVIGASSVLIVAIVASLFYFYPVSQPKPSDQIAKFVQPAQTVENKVASSTANNTETVLATTNQNKVVPKSILKDTPQNHPQEEGKQVVDSKITTIPEVLGSAKPKQAVVVSETIFKPLLSKVLPISPEDLPHTTFADTIRPAEVEELEAMVFTICKGEEVLLNAGDGSRYNWEHGAITQSVVVVPDEDAFYAVEYTGVNGNRIKQRFDVYLLDCSLYVPKAFSPNDDGSNDTYKLRTDGIHQFEIKIFSKWGELVFECKNPEIGWDGRIKGAKAPVGVYIYQVSFRDIKDNSRAIFGTLTLLP